MFSSVRQAGGVIYLCKAPRKQGVVRPGAAINNALLQPAAVCEALLKYPWNTPARLLLYYCRQLVCAKALLQFSYNTPAILL